MTVNFPGPYEIRLFYTTNVSGLALPHQMRYNINLQNPPNPGDAFSTITHIAEDSVLTQLDTWVNNLVTVLAPLYNNAFATFDYAELWAYTAGTFDAQFISVHTLGVAGTSASGINSAHMLQYTFRSREGGVMKVVLLETVSTLRGKQDFGSLSATSLAFVNFLLPAIGSAQVLARDTSYPFGFRYAYGGESEAVFKKRYRA